jgi:hypothetical protein
MERDFVYSYAFGFIFTWKTYFFTNQILAY